MRIGIDFGGTKIEAIALDDDGTTLARERVPTPRDDYAATLATIRDMAPDFDRLANDIAPERLTECLPALTETRKVLDEQRN